MVVKVNVINLNNEVVGSVSLNPSIFCEEMRIDILHRIVEWQRSKRRAGTHKTKIISEVSGTTKKPFNQKGGGRARQGSLRSPQFRGGAVIFGPVVRSHEYDMPKSIRRKALKVALSAKLADSRLLLIDNLSLDTYKTKDLTAKIQKIGLSSVLFVGVDKEKDSNFCRASSNLQSIDVIPTAGINVYDILNHEYLILTTDAVETITQRLA
jgi:large subunit ribosomal protein L4